MAISAHRCCSSALQGASSVPLLLAPTEQLCQRYPLAGIVVAEGCAEAPQVAQLGLCGLPLHELPALLPQLFQCWQDVLLQQLQGQQERPVRDFGPRPA